MHSEISGVTDYKMPDDQTCLETVRSLVEKLGQGPQAGFNRVKPLAPEFAPKELLGIVPSDRAKPYDMWEVINRIIDRGSADEYKADYGKTVITTYARVDGWSVGSWPINEK